ncbi:hypothetical protein ACRBEV_10180 [Methylobacterium phyllosphaerae]
MQIRNRSTVKPLSDVQVGELFWFQLNSGRALGIALRRLQGGTLKIGVLRADAIDAPQPFHFDLADPDPCLSYGEDWEIEPLPGPETLPGDMRHVETDGAVHITARGLTLRFHRTPQNISSSGFSYDLLNREAANFNRDDCAPVLRWRIWASAASPRHPGELPVFEFDAGAPVTGR